MSDSRKILDLVSFDVDHGLGEVSGPFVGVRAYSGSGDVLYGQLPPELARQLANDLFASAARSEYESDLYSELIEIKMPDEGIAMMMLAVRKGEVRRHLNIKEQT